MGVARSFRDLRVYRLARKAVSEIFEDALDRGYLAPEQFKRMDDHWFAITSMLTRMIDRAADFCKYSSDADYRGIVNEEPLTADDSFFAELDEQTP